MDRAYKWINRIILAVLAFVPLVFVPIGKYGDYFYKPKYVALGVIMAVYVVFLLIYRKKIGQLIDCDKVNLSLLIYFTLLIISLFFALNTYLAIFGENYRVEGLSTIMLYLLVFLAARSIQKQNNQLFKFVLITSCIISLYGILQYYGIDPFPRNVFHAGAKIAFSTIGNPNFLGSYLVLMLPLTYYFYVNKGKKLSLVAFIILFWCILATNTRSAWLGSMAAFLIYFGVLFKERNNQNNTKELLKRSIILTVLAVVLLISFNIQSDNNFIHRFLSISNEAVEVATGGEKAARAGSGRIFIWKRVIELIQMKPLFGFGLENLHIPFLVYYKDDILNFFGRIVYCDKAHNEYLHIAVSSGIPSLFAYLAFVFLSLKKGIKRIGRMEIALPLTAAVIGYLVQAFFNISVVSVAYVYWAFLGLLVGSSTGLKQDYINTE